MSYTPIEWETGDVVTAAKLNKMDGQISVLSNAFIVTVTESDIESDYVTDKTYNEIKDAILANKCVLFYKETESSGVSAIKPIGYEYDENSYKILMENGNYYMSESADAVMHYYPW